MWIVWIVDCAFCVESTQGVLHVCTVSTRGQHNIWMLLFPIFIDQMVINLCNMYYLLYYLHVYKYEL